MFISGYANTVVKSHHISQSYFKTEIENGHPVFKVLFNKLAVRVSSGIRHETIAEFYT